MDKGQDSGDKTEQATPKKLRDARKRGDVAKGRDLTSTLSFAFSLALMWLAWRYCTEQIVALTDSVLTLFNADFFTVLPQIGQQAVTILLIVSALLILPVIAFGMLVEFLQVGPIFTAQKIKPRMSHLNVVEGLKRMFSMDSLVDLVRNIIKTIVLCSVAFILIRAAMDSLVHLPAASAEDVAYSLGRLTLLLLGWTLAFYLFISVLDTAYRHHAFAKKMKMSMRDIKKETKESEGDPMVKGQRRQLHQEWSQQSATGAAGQASVLVVNPTHVAVAILFDEEDSPVPLVTAKGEHELARLMRDAANDHHVPVVRNERLARTLLADVDEGDPVPEGLFDIVAEVIFWARRVTENLEILHQPNSFSNRSPVPAAPGEDLTAYPVYALATAEAAPVIET